MPVARFWQTRKTPAFIVDVLESAETFGNGAGVLLLLIVVFALRAVPTRALIRLVTVSLGSGLLADFFKLLVARTRPRDLTIQQNALETFCGWFSPSTASSATHSFPSAHVATAVGLAFALSYYFPRGRFVFAGLVCLVLVQRLQTGAHFVSDTLAGAALGLGPALVFFGVRPIAAWFDQFERGTEAVASVNSRVPTRHFPVQP
jgi:membrane-associated phospholipid phosphatase